MGQYYRPVFLNKEKNKPVAHVRAFDFGSSSKLTGHSWLRNDLVGFVERQLLVEARPIVWGGDYADEELDSDKNLYKMTQDSAKLTVVFDFNAGEHAYNTDLNQALPARYKYLINYDKKEFVDKSKTPNKDGWILHPLPILTCEGNGRGGGDYNGESELVGAWSRDVIGVKSRKTDIPKGFKEIEFNLF